MSAQTVVPGSSSDAAVPANGDPRADEAQLALIRELVGSLMTPSPADQRQAMGKIVALLHEHANEMSSSLSLANRQWLATVLERLDEEAGCRRSNPERFADRAEDVLTLLAAVGPSSQRRRLGL
jgi:Ser/Thr protein kinase RdoA (MazF antagonist)